MRKIIVSTLLSLFMPICYAAEFPLSVKAENGIVKLEKKPERIIVLEFGLLDELKLLGVKPVGMGKSDNTEGQDPAHLQEFIKDIPGVGTRDEPSLEAIAKLKPDLIIGEVTFISNLLPQLNKIAPTVLLNGILGDPAEQVKNLKILASITNTENKVDGIIKHHDQIREQAIALSKKSKHKSVLMGFITPSGIFRVLSSNAIATPILKDLNKTNLIKETSVMHRVDITVEGVLQKNPDQIVILLTDGDLAPYTKLKANPLWKDVRAFKAEQIYFLDRNVWAKTHGIEAMEVMYEEAMKSGFLDSKPQKLNSNKNNI
ncbi:iron-siderophore ABC transporter substrate-binding protein [Fluviispira multicolorata]|uniref:ABC transporter substrate-binding protein n=1 Tax=Fluviispira multicolorata TaxID=2654512 RepID=A0A833N820_9BACT|nr:iron-siderophore ABC transporter substrate-binding protein [Fluviispira multicolorata]KAB8033551.1 ABC transporter substrate-binding protein [Fluviispira multicolorata]